MPRAATELAKEWRTDRVLRRLEALMAVADREVHAAGQRHRRRDPADRRHRGDRLGRQLRGGGGPGPGRPIPTLDAAEIVRTALEIAAGIDIYTNTNIVVEEMECESDRPLRTIGPPRRDN